MTMCMDFVVFGASEHLNSPGTRSGKPRSSVPSCFRARAASTAYRQDAVRTPQRLGDRDCAAHGFRSSFGLATAISAVLLASGSSLGAPRSASSRRRVAAGGGVKWRPSEGVSAC